ncbi:phage associated protein [Neisseria gonorrhoeae]|nr:phage associated protein [Neisseria gonorrhoeae]
MDKVFIKYIGGGAVWRDRIYHTGLVFEDGQVREVSAGAAAKLLRHGDVFAAVPGKRVEKADDTEALEKAGASELERETAAFDAVQDVILQINRMGKDELELYAKANYGQGLDKRKSAENLRGDVVRMVRQFGIAQ